MNPGRNDPCPCGSGKKYKKCCQGKFEPRLPLRTGQQSANTVAPNGRSKRTAPTPVEFNQLVALFNAGHHAELESQTRSLLERYPDSGFAWKVLGATLQMQGKDSLAALRKAMELLPDDADAHYNLGNTLLILGRLDEAEASYRRALQVWPDYVDAHYNLGNTLRNLGRLDEAEASYRRALQVKPDYAEVHGNLGNIMLEQGRLAEAEASYRRALQIKPDYAVAHYNLGNLLHDLNRLDEAEASYRRTLEIKPDYVGAHNNLGITLLDLGRMDEAEASHRRALEINPDFVEGRFSLAQVRKVQAGDENLAALVAIEEAAQNGATPLSDKEAVYLHFALGKSYDDIGDYEKAFPHFLKGCKLKRATFDYDPDQTAQHFASIMHVFDHPAMDRLRGGGDPSPLPIFVLGMPRSGTTLTEQIIASHPEVHGAGELPDLMAIAQRNIAGATFPDNLRSLDQARLAAWGAEYVAGLQRRAPDARHITDKMPENFLAVGLIHLMLPHAKIIHVNRNPVDTCLSCFTKLFNRKHEYSYDLAELGRYYVGYARLMEHWRTVLPSGAFLDVQYEDIVADQEAQSRRLIEYCGLEWNDVCLDFHNNKRAISTASMTQVRQPIYKSSVERWRPYEKFLGPLLDALGELAPGR
ncbi:MAG: tetratricopeptide repeat protein [Gallionella sp.]|nr:tetratricopeptide repeat protein [Gallionella sp.]